MRALDNICAFFRAQVWQNPRRPGVSLIEVLVVIAIFGLLLGLTAACVMNVRRASLKAQCSDQMRQIGMALHAYHDNFKRLPAGVVHPLLRPGVPRIFGPDTDPYPHMTWHMRLLPFIEQNGLWAQIIAAYRIDPYDFADPPHSAKSARIPLFVCPADGPGGQPANSKLARPGTTSYLGVCGLSSKLKDGVFYMDSQTRFAAISDGLSNTVAVGERPPSPDLEFGRWHGDWGPWGHLNSFLAVTEQRNPRLTSGCQEGTVQFQSGNWDDRCSIYHFWSLHLRGAHFLLADGSVRFLPYSAARILPALATIAGGEPVSVLD